MTPVVSGYFFFCLLSYFWMQLKVIINLKKTKKQYVYLCEEIVCVLTAVLSAKGLSIFTVHYFANPIPSTPHTNKKQTNKQKHLVGSRFFSNVLQCPININALKSIV